MKKHSQFVSLHSKIWNNNPASLLRGYAYNPSLTKELDNLSPDLLTLECLYKIVLWKVNRFPIFANPAQLLTQLKLASGFEKKENARALLEMLLKTPGIALPMASTILRFINPNVFQIIDDRAYRVLFPGEKKYPAKTKKVSDTYVNESLRIYFDYLDRLQEICGPQLPFKDADRILYMLDKKIGNTLGKK